MKTMLMTILLIGSIKVMHSQSDMAYVEATNVTQTKNHSNGIIKEDRKYENETAYLAEKSKKLQLQALNYDIKNANVYVPNLETTYAVNFTEGINKINAIYAQDGALLKSEGSFENVRVPYNIGVKLAKTYPGWEFHKTWCYSHYEMDKNTQIIYKLQLKKGNKTKMITINPIDYSL
ncbi:MAG: hypothetical protein ABIO60_12035 [Aquaticitalea sp.]